MKAYKFIASAVSILMAVCMASCDEKNDEPTVTKTHIYFATSDPTTLVQGSSAELTVAMTLSVPVTETTTFELEADGTAAQALVFDPQTVTISAGTNLTAFKVSIDNSVEFTEEVSAKISIKGLNEDAFDIREDLVITIVPAAQIGEAEAAFAAAFMAAHGIDLTPWFGDVALTGTIEFPGGGNLSTFTEPTTIPLNGSTTFHLNPASTLDNVILDMTSNPMGMTTYLHDAFRKLTVEDKEFFASEDEDNYGGPELMELINWNDASTETFKATLPGMALTFDFQNRTATVNFVKEGENYYLDANGEPFVDEEGEPIYMTWNDSRIGFEYAYSAWERNFAKIMSGDPIAVELLGYGITAHPGAWLGMSSVLEDEWLLEEDGEVSLFCTPTGIIDFSNGTMTFEFPFDHADQYGYSRVKVTYTIQK